jgi:hypothetical protein
MSTLFGPGQCEKLSPVLFDSPTGRELNSFSINLVQKALGSGLFFPLQREAFQKILDVLAAVEKVLMTFGAEKFHCLRLKALLFQAHLASFIQVHG